MRSLTCCETDEPAPRVGCACSGCYHAREMALDPRLLELARPDYVSLTDVRPSKAIVQRALMHYLRGEIDYGLLHLTIIKALMDQNDQQHEHLCTMAMATPGLTFLSEP
jgi:hypothetical protein